jgi:hypothetical protein
VDQTVAHKIAGITNMAADICGVPYSEIAGLSDTLLALPKPDENPVLGGRSGLNSDGTPLQFCISSRKEGWAGRLIADPASTYFIVEDRYLKSIDAIELLFERSKSAELKPLFEEMVKFHLPESKSVEDYPDGVFWLGSPVQGSGIAIYMDGRRGGNEIGWNRLRDWLRMMMPEISGLDEWIDATGKVGDIMSIGFEGSSLKNVRAKIYWRLREAALLDSLNCEILKHQEFKNFLGELAGDKQLRLFGMVFSLGFHISSQQFFDVKIDMCGCKDCLNYSASEWVGKFKHFTEKYNIAPFPVSREMLEYNAAVSYFGFGMDVRQEKRLNLYLNSHG